MQIISAPSGPGSLRIDLRCDLHEVRPAADVFRDFLSGAGWPQADLMDCELAFVEACNNAIEYVDPSAAEQPVTVEASVNPAELELRITDHTRGFEWPQKPVLPNPESERGRGLFLIRTVMDEAIYSRRAGENTLLLRKKRTASN